MVRSATGPSAPHDAEGSIDVLSSTSAEPLLGPVTAPESLAAHLPRLARHTIELADGHRVGVAVVEAGRGVAVVGTC